jgi:excisionase family DNA binding protein
MDSEHIKARALQEATILLTYKDAAGQLGISVRTLQRYIADGLLRAIAITRRTKRVRLSELEDFIQRMSEQIDDRPVPEPEQGSQMRFDFIEAIPRAREGHHE